jgi:hypothetical protein
MGMKVVGCDNDTSWLTNPWWSYVVTFCDAYIGTVPKLIPRNQFQVSVSFADSGVVWQKYVHDKWCLFMTRGEAEDYIRSLFFRTNLSIATVGDWVTEFPFLESSVIQKNPQWMELVRKREALRSELKAVEALMKMVSV